MTFGFVWNGIEGWQRNNGRRSALEFLPKCGLICAPMKIKGVIFDMDGTITAPYFDFNKIRDEAGIGDIDMLDYLGTAVGVEHARVTADLEKRTEDYCAISRLINKEAIWFWTFQNTYYAISNAKLKGLPKIYSGVVDVSDVWME